MDTTNNTQAAVNATAEPTRTYPRYFIAGQPAACKTRNCGAVMLTPCTMNGVGRELVYGTMIHLVNVHWNGNWADAYHGAIFYEN